MEKLCILSEVILEKARLIYLPEWLGRRLCGDSVGRGQYFLWRFYSKISLGIVWAFHGENMVNQITRQYPY